MDDSWAASGLLQGGEGVGGEGLGGRSPDEIQHTHSFLIFRYTVNTGFKEACKHVPNAVWDIFMLNKYFVVYLHSKR